MLCAQPNTFGLFCACNLVASGLLAINLPLGERLQLHQRVASSTSPCTERVDYLITYHVCYPPRVLIASNLLVLEVITQEAGCFEQGSLVSSDWLGRRRKYISYTPFPNKITLDLA
jgi:hypothetical protein